MTRPNTNLAASVRERLLKDASAQAAWNHESFASTWPPGGPWG